MAKVQPFGKISKKIDFAGNAAKSIKPTYIHIAGIGKFYSNGHFLEDSSIEYNLAARHVVAHIAQISKDNHGNYVHISELQSAQAKIKILRDVMNNPYDLHKVKHALEATK